VLVVDDNKDAVDMLSMWLEMEGYPVVSATSGRAALELAAVQPPDVVLVDLGMPEMDGYELARRLRAMPSLKTLRIVAVSGYGEEEYRRQAREAGIVEHLVKPVDIDTLIDAIESRGEARA
jgi:CheY-like chemotaxis protein